MEIKSIYERLMIVDGSHLLHRSICEPHLWEMTSLDGQKTGGVYGTLQSLLKETNNYQYFPVVVFDGHLSQRRLSIYPNYKRNEEKQLLTESVNTLSETELLQKQQKYEYNQQREILKVLLPSFGIPTIHLPDWEGDDIIYILTLLTKDSIVLSDDKDLIQLVCKDNDRQCCVRRGMRNEFIDMKWFEDNNLTRDNFVACKAIVGDPSDNIPSACFQVGEKTAPTLLKLYQESNTRLGGFPKDEKELESKCKEINIPKRKAYLNFNEEQFLNNIKLMDLNYVKNEIDYDLINQLDETIINTAGINNVEIIQNVLDSLNIKGFIANNLLNNISRSLRYIAEKPINVPKATSSKFKLF